MYHPKDVYEFQKLLYSYEIIFKIYLIKSLKIIYFSNLWQIITLYFILRFFKFPKHFNRTFRLYTLVFKSPNFILCYIFLHLTNGLKLRLVFATCTDTNETVFKREKQKKTCLNPKGIKAKWISKTNEFGKMKKKMSLAL